MKVTKEKVDKALLELEKKHNWSWAREIDFRNNGDDECKTIFYRGTEINYREFKEKSDAMAKSLIAYGFKKGDEVPICSSNIPELVMLLRAISVIGAKAHIFGDEFDKDYITEIIDSTKSKTLFVSDNLYEHLKKSIANTKHLENIVMFSLADSLPHGLDPYKKYDERYCNFANKVSTYQAEDARIQTKNEFLEASKIIEGEVFDDTVGLDDEFLITYTSGSTNAAKPKGIVHTNRSLITMGRFHDPDLSGLPATRHIRNLIHIPTHSNTDIITGISDSLIQNCELALEPIYQPNFFIYSLMINKPHFAPATRSFWINACKQYLNDENLKGIKFKNMYIPTVVGEPMSPGEEKFINSTLRSWDAGVTKMPKPIGPVTVSFGGGDCEHGGIYFTLFKRHMELLNRAKLRKDSIGLKPFNPAIETVCLDEFGRVLGPNQMGILAGKSPLTMKEYKNNPEATENFFVKANNGKTYGNLNVHGYIDYYGTIHMKGRADAIVKLPNGQELPLFRIKEVIEKDTKDILSCEVVMVKGAIVAHIDPMPYIHKNNCDLLEKVVKRVKSTFSEDLVNMMLFGVRTCENPYPLTGCGKRNTPALVNEGLTDELYKPEFTGNYINLSQPFLGESRKRV